MIELDLNKIRKLETDFAAVEQLRWSPDSNRIVFVTDFDRNREIILLDFEIGKFVRITVDPLDNISPRWSADSRYLYYFTKKKTGEIDVSVIDFTSAFKTKPESESIER